MQWTENGSLCSRTLDSGWAWETWVVTQSILRTSMASYPLEIKVQVYAERDRDVCAASTCRLGQIDVYYFPSKGAVGNDQRLNISNYQPVAGYIKLNFNATYFNVSFNLNASYDRFYVAVQNPYAYAYSIKLRGLRVFYTTCSKS